jgi:hypothetical protein
MACNLAVINTTRNPFSSVNPWQMKSYRHNVAPGHTITKLFVQTAVNVIPRLHLTYLLFFPVQCV